MSYCDFEHCTGHLGKHSSCLSEALWEAGNDWWDESGGDVDGPGYAALIIADKEFTIPADCWSGDHDFVVPAGTFVVLLQVSSGQVFLTEFETADDAQSTYDDFIREYDIWSEANGY